jgi:hypothetical protein
MNTDNNLISYAHVSDPNGDRFCQYASDPIPSWAVNVRDDEEFLPQIYQATLVNFGNDDYIGESLHDAMDAAKKAGLEAVVLLDGALVASYSPIVGWKHYAPVE